MAITSISCISVGNVYQSQREKFSSKISNCLVTISPNIQKNEINKIDHIDASADDMISVKLKLSADFDEMHAYEKESFINLFHK